MRPYGFQWVFMCSYRSLFVLMESTGSLCVLIGPDVCLWVLMGLYKSLFVFIEFDGILWVLRVPFVSLWILMGALCVIMCRYSSLRILMDPYGSL